MTDDLTAAEQALRDVLTVHAAEVPAPVGVYAAVRARHHRRRVVLGAGLAAVLVAGAVPAALAATRPAEPPPLPVAAGPGCDVGRGITPLSADFPRQTGVAGSLGGDRQLVQAVLRAGWARMQQPGTLWDGGTVKASTARVTFVDRVDGMIVAGMTASSGKGPLSVDAAVNAMQVTVVGRHRDALTATPAGSWSAEGDDTEHARPEGNLQMLTDAQPISGFRVCGIDFAVVRARPQAVATLRRVAEIRPDASARWVTEALPLTRGFGIVRRPPGPAEVTVTGNGGAPVTRKVPVYHTDPFGLRVFTDEQVAAAVRASGYSDPEVVDAAQTAVLLSGEAAAGQPVSDLRVDALPIAAGRRGYLVSFGLPGGARVVAAGDAPRGPRFVSAGPTFVGLLPAGAMDRSVLAWFLQYDGPTHPGPVPLAIYAPRGARAEVVRGAQVSRVDLVAGAGLVLTHTEGTRVRVYTAGGSLVGTAVPDAGLVAPPS